MTAERKTFSKVLRHPANHTHFPYLAHEEGKRTQKGHLEGKEEKDFFLPFLSGLLRREKEEEHCGKGENDDEARTSFFFRPIVFWPFSSPGFRMWVGDR